MNTEIIREALEAMRTVAELTGPNDPYDCRKYADSAIAALDDAEQEAVPLKFPVKVPEGQAEMARRLLWIAFNWNDHNFSHPPEYYAREAASEYGINNLDQANDWLSGNKEQP